MVMQDKISLLRKKIFNDVKRLYKLEKQKEKKFIPGKDRVNCSARVYDEK